MQGAIENAAAHRWFWLGPALASLCWAGQTMCWWAAARNNRPPSVWLAHAAGTMLAGVLIAMLMWRRLPAMRGGVLIEPKPWEATWYGLAAGALGVIGIAFLTWGIRNHPDRAGSSNLIAGLYPFLAYLPFVLLKVEPLTPIKLAGVALALIGFVLLAS